MQSKLRTILWSITLTAGLALSGCTPGASKPAQGPIVAKDGKGNTLSLAAAAQRVVSLSPGSTEILYAIGAGAQVVGRDSYSDYPEAVKAVPDVSGGFGDLNTETIFSLKPDLVLVSDLTPPEKVKAMQDLKLNVFSLGNPTDFEGMYQNLQVVAKMTGHEAEANALIEKSKARVAAVQAKISETTKRPLVFYELDGTDPSAPWTSGPGSFVGMLINMAGGKNLGDNLSSAWAQISLEELINKNPDIVLIGDATWGGVTLEAVKARTGWNALNAIKNDVLYTFDDNLVSRPGPRLVDGLEAMAKLLHPELFQ
jgi:iron complex transport system substrate-binding protein